MTAQKGSAFLLKLSDGAPTPADRTVAGLRTTQMSITGDTVVVTHKQSGGWRELLGGAGVRSASISGSGVFRDEATDARARQAFFDGEVPRFQVVIPGFGTVEGPFQISGLEYAGSYNGEATYELSLASAGALSFLAVAVIEP